MPIRGEATADLGGRKLTLKVNFATLARTAAETRIQAAEVFKIIENEADPRQMLVALAMIEQSLKRHHPEIDEDALGDLMIDHGDALSGALRDAVMGAFGDGEAEQADTGENPPKRGTGMRSKPNGRRPAKIQGSSGTKRRAASQT